MSTSTSKSAKIIKDLKKKIGDLKRENKILRASLFSTQPDHHKTCMHGYQAGHTVTYNGHTDTCPGGQSGGDGFGVV